MCAKRVKVIPAGRGSYSEYEYMYASAKTAVLSRALAGSDKTEALLDAGSAVETLARLAEFGITRSQTPGDAPEQNDGADFERLLTGFLAERYNELFSYCPDTGLVSLCRYRYDCHNVKTAIKCRFLGHDAAPFMIDCGTVAPERLISAAELHDFSLLPENMAAAAKTADAELDATQSARAVDSAIDRACYADMLDAARKVGFAPVTELVRLKIDLTNIMTALRTGRIRNPEAARALLDGSLIPGGNIDTGLFGDAGKPEKVADIAGNAGFTALSAAITAAPRTAAGLEEISLRCDECFVKRTRELTAFRMLGAYPLVAYVVALEYEVKNLRIIISGKESGADAQTIRERLRIFNV